MRSQFCGSFMALMSRSWFTVILNWAPKTNAVPRRTNAVIVRVRDLGVIMGTIKPQVGCRHKAFGPPRDTRSRPRDTRGDGDHELSNRLPCVAGPWPL